MAICEICRKAFFKQGFTIGRETEKDISQLYFCNNCSKKLFGDIKILNETLDEYSSIKASACYYYYFKEQTKQRWITKKSLNIIFGKEFDDYF